MVSQLERAIDALFPQEGGSRVGNVKFYSGHNRDVTAEQLAEQLNRADAQVRLGDIQPVVDIDGDLNG